MKHLTLALVLSAVSASALANNTVRFEGEVSDETCTVDVNGSGSPTILLPTVRTTEITSATDLVSATTLVIGVSNCKAGLTSWGVRLLGDAVTEAGDLANQATTTPATGVAIRITDKTQQVDFSDAYVVVAGEDLASGETSGEIVLEAGYVLEKAGDTATPGYVSASMQYAFHHN